MKEKLAFYFKKYPAFSYAATIALFILLEGLYSFCTVRKPDPVACPAFNDPNYDLWFPYQLNQKLRFTSNLGKKDSLTIGHASKSDAFTGNGSCNAFAQFWSVENNTTGNALNINYYYDQNGNSLNVTLIDFTTFGSLNANGFTPSSHTGSTSSQLSTITLNNKTFSNIIQVQRDTVNYKQNGVYKFWMARNIGFVGFERYPTLERSVLD